MQDGLYAPPAPGMDLAELRCFDPNNCDCVGFHSLQNVSSFGDGHTDPTKSIFPPVLGFREGITYE